MLHSSELSSLGTNLRSAVGLNTVIWLSWNTTPQKNDSVKRTSCTAHPKDFWSGSEEYHPQCRQDCWLNKAIFYIWEGLFSRSVLQIWKKHPKLIIKEAKQTNKYSPLPWDPRVCFLHSSQFLCMIETECRGTMWGVCFKSSETWRWLLLQRKPSRAWMTINLRECAGMIYLAQKLCEVNTSQISIKELHWSLRSVKDGLAFCTRANTHPRCCHVSICTDVASGWYEWSPT